MPITATQPGPKAVIKCKRCKRVKCRLISQHPLRIWRCPKCERITCPIVWKTTELIKWAGYHEESSG